MLDTPHLLLRTGERSNSYLSAAGSARALELAPRANRILALPAWISVPRKETIMRRMPTDAASLAACLAIATGAILGMDVALAQPPVPPSLESGTVAGQPSGAIYQDASDLERTRNEVYGQLLSTTQHDEIASWRVESPDWWLDSARVDRALAVRASIAETLAQMQEPDTVAEADQALRDAHHLFGFRVELVVDSSNGGSEGNGTRPTTVEEYTISYSAAERPDLFLLHEALASVMTSYQSMLRSNGPAAYTLFHRIFPHAPVDGERPEEAPHLIFGRQVDAYLEALLDDARLTVDDYYSPIAAAHAANDFANYTLADALAYRREIERLETESYIRVGQSFLDGLSEQSRKELIQFLVRYYIPSLRKHVIYASNASELAQIDFLRQGGR